MQCAGYLDTAARQPYVSRQYLAQQHTPGVCVGFLLFCCAAGIPQMQVAELSRSALPAAGGQQADSSSTSTGQLITAETLVRDLAILLTSSNSSSSRGGAAVESYQAAAQRLHVVAHDLPRVLSGPLQELLSAFTNSNLADAGSLQRRQQQLQVFLQVVASELPQQLPSAQGTRCATSSSSSWSAAGHSQADQAAAEGLLHLLGEQDSGEVLQHGAEQPSRSRASGPRAGRDDDGDGDDQGHLHGWLANIHHDQDMQRYMQVRRRLTAVLRLLQEHLARLQYLARLLVQATCLAGQLVIQTTMDVAKQPLGPSWRAELFYYVTRLCPLPERADAANTHTPLSSPD